MKKVFTISVLFAILLAVFLIQPTAGKTKPYYSGKTVGYNGTFYVGTVNTGNFEFFALRNGNLEKVTDIQSMDKESKEFADLLFDQVDGNLYVYLVNGRYLYKYDISNPLIPSVLLKIKDNSWDWFTRVEKVNGNLVTIGSKGAKVWNKNMQVIDSYPMINSSNLGYSKFIDNGKLIANLKDTLNVYDTASRKKVSEYQIAVNDPTANRAITSDENLIYLVDDQSLKAVTFNGQVVNQFTHAGDRGYDVIDSTDPNYLYFSDGLGIVKVEKETLRPAKWNWTINNAPAGSWAMGMSSANDDGGEKIAVFNGTNILVIDQNMKTVATYMAMENDTNPTEPLSLGIDRNFGLPGSQIIVNGAGFALKEKVRIEIKDVNVGVIPTDDYGRFSSFVSVPSVNYHPITVDVRATGLTSGRTYSISFLVK
jgi:hypothetical protein